MLARLVAIVAASLAICQLLQGCGGGGSGPTPGPNPDLAKVAEQFFQCCETGQGWANCSQYVDEKAPFSIEAVDALPGPNVTDNKFVKDYLDWMAGVVKEFGPKATVTVKAKSFDEGTNTAMYYAVFMGYSDYVYIINIDPTKMKVSGLTKVWNDQYAFNNMPNIPGVVREAKQQLGDEVSDNPAQDFFDCCEKGKGWAGCQQYVTDENAPFSIEAVNALPGPKVTDAISVKDYLDWMAGVVKEFGAKATYTVKAHGFDKSTNTAMYYAVFMGYSDYVYAINLDPKTNKVSGLTKVWNDQYAFNNIPHSRAVAVTV